VGRPLTGEFFRASSGFRLSSIRKRGLQQPRGWGTDGLDGDFADDGDMAGNGYIADNLKGSVHPLQARLAFNNPVRRSAEKGRAGLKAD
jgi:hypothetical protein